MVFLTPLVYAAIASFQGSRTLLDLRPTLIFRPVLSNYESLFTEYDFSRVFVNSVVSSAGSMAFALLVGTPAAYALCRCEWRGRTSLLLAVLTGRALPAFAVGIGFYVVFLKLGLLDTWWVLIVAYLPYNLALITWLMYSYFRSVPRELDEAATVDGCGHVATFWRVILPVARPALGSCGIFAFLFGWNNFILPLVLTAHSGETLTVAATQFVGEYEPQWGLVMAAVVIMAAPLVGMGVVFRRYMVPGLGAGAVRG